MSPVKVVEPKDPCYCAHCAAKKGPFITRNSDCRGVVYRIFAAAGFTRLRENFGFLSGLHML